MNKRDLFGRARDGGRRRRADRVAAEEGGRRSEKKKKKKGQGSRRRHPKKRKGLSRRGEVRRGRGYVGYVRSRTLDRRYVAYTL